MAWRHKGEENFPSNGEELKESIESGNLFDFAVIIASWVQKAGVFELLAPGDILLLINAFKELLESLGLFLLFFISDNLNDAGVSLANFNGRRLSIRNLKPKDLVTGLVFLQLTLDNLDGNLLLSFIVFKMKGSFAVFVVFTGNTDFASSVGNLYGFIVAGNFAV